MTPAQRLRREILSRIDWSDDEPPILVIPPDATGEQIDELYDEGLDDTDLYDAIQEIRDELRCEGLPTGIKPRDYSRHYECNEVATLLSDGTWVGWTYWYGGGKYGEPEAIKWIDDAYDIECTETEKLVVVREFKVKE